MKLSHNSSLKISLFGFDLCEVVADNAGGRIDYQLIEMPSSKLNC